MPANEPVARVEAVQTVRRVIDRIRAAWIAAQSRITSFEKSKSMERIRQARREFRAKTAGLKKLGADAKAALAPLQKFAGFTGKGLAQFIGSLAVAYFSIRLISRAVRSIARGLKEWVKSGFQLNRLFELMRIGTAATLAQNAEIIDATGRQIRGLEAVVALQGQSLTLQDKIVAAAFESGSTLQNFLDAFRIALPLALQLGNTVEDTVDVTKRLVLAATAIGIPFDLVRLQIDDILRGLITTRTTLARVLGLTQQQLRVAREQGTIIDLVREKTDAFLKAQELIANTFAISLNRAKLLAEVVAREVTGRAFGKLRDVLRSIVERISTVNRLTGELEIRPKFQKAIDLLKGAFDNFTNAVLTGAPLIIGAFSAMGTVVSFLAKQMAGVVGLFQSIKAGTLTSQAASLREQAERLETSLKSVGDRKGLPGGLAEGLPSAPEIMKRITSLKDQADALDDAAIAASEAAMNTAAAYKEFRTATKDAQTALRDLQEAFKDLQEVQSGGLDISLDKALENVTKGAEVFKKLEKETKALGLTREERSARMEELLTLVLGVAPKDALNVFLESQKIVSASAELARAKLEMALEAQRLARSRVKLSVSQKEKLALSLEFLGLPSPEALAEAIEKFKKEAGRLTITPVAALKDPGKLVLEERAKGAAKELAIRERQALVERDIILLGRSQLDLTDEERTKQLASLRIRKSELDISAKRAVIESQEKIVKVALEKDRERARLRGLQVQLVKLETNLFAAQVRQANELLAIAKKRAGAARKADEIRRETELIGQTVEAQRDILKARRDLLDVQKISTDRELVAVAIAERGLALAEARLKIQQAVAAAFEQAEKVRQAVGELARGGTQSPEQVSEKIAIVLREQAKLNQANLDTEKVRQALAEAILKGHKGVVEALREQQGLSSSLVRAMNTLADVVSSFSGGLSESLNRAFATFKSLSKLGKDFTKDVQEGLKGMMKPGDIEKIVTFKDALGAAFKSWKNFKASMKEGLGNTLGLLGTVGANFAKSVKDGIASLLLLVGQFIPGGQFLQGIGLVVSMMDKIGFSFKGFLKTGFSPLGGLILGTAEKKKTRKIAREIVKVVNETILSFNAGAKTLGDTIVGLERERAAAVSRLSGRKGGEKELKQVTGQIDEQLAKLRRQQKDIFEDFRRELKILRLDEAFEDIGRSVESLNKRIRDFLDAGGSYIEAQEFLARSTQRLISELNRDLREDELQTISLLEREIELHEQREEVIQSAADRERAVRSRLGLAQMLTPAQQAAQEIKAIRDARDEQLERINRELELLDAQLGGKRKLFGIESDLNVLHERRLDLTRAGTSEIVKQIRALKDFLSVNSQAIEQFRAAYATNFQSPILPQFAGSRFVAGGVTYQFGDVNLQLAAGMSPREGWELFERSIKYGAETSRVRLET